MPALHIDLETRSTVDLRKTGVYRYAEDPTTDVWCAAYAPNDGPIMLWTPERDIPECVEATIREGWPVIAHNANFERVIWKKILHERYGWPLPKLSQWRCTMAMALAMSLPASLENAAAAAGLETRKDMSGRLEMLRMSRPRKARKGEDPDGLYWFDDEERRERLYAYCKQDVEVERQLHKGLLTLSPFEQGMWQLDQLINDRGVCVDEQLCNAALDIVQIETDRLNHRLRQLTDGYVSAATNVGQIAAWLREAHKIYAASLDKEAVCALLADPRRTTPDVHEVLEIRQAVSNMSVRKINALLAGRSKDGRARGLLQYHAASTGRWAGRRFQPQNIKRPELEDVDKAISIVAGGNVDRVRDAYPDLSPLAVVGDCLRGMVRARPGATLIAGDFANIEGRVLAWLADETWKIEAFRAFDRGEGPDIYKLAYARAFRKKPEDVTKEERQVGKVMELALGYQGGVGAFQTMASNYGIEVSDERADELKVAWREAHPNIVQFWYDLERASKNALYHEGQTFNAGAHIAFRYIGGMLYCRLPSKRVLCYPYPKIEPRKTPWGEERDTVIYQGTDSYTRKWGDCKAYGGLWAENVTQAVARDVLADAMRRLHKAGYPIVLTVHDEIVVEADVAADCSVDEFEAILTASPSWADGLPIAAEAWEGERYRK